MFHDLFPTCSILPRRFYFRFVIYDLHTDTVPHRPMNPGSHGRAGYAAITLLIPALRLPVLKIIAEQRN
jgi:hypothetical protein